MPYETLEDVAVGKLQDTNISRFALLGITTTVHQYRYYTSVAAVLERDVAGADD